MTVRTQSPLLAILGTVVVSTGTDWPPFLGR